MHWDIGPGSTVSMFFCIRLEDGMIAESNFGEEPLNFTMGDKTLVKGLEYALFGLRAGDKQSIRISPEEGFGYPEQIKKQIIPRSKFPNQMELAEGAIVEFAAGEATAEEQIPGVITKIDGDDIHVDFNHPLAGHEILFEVEILSVGPANGMI